MNELNDELQQLKELKKEMLKLEEKYKQEQDWVMNELLKGKSSVKWMLVNEELDCLLHEDLITYFEYISNYFFESEELQKEILGSFINDVKISVLMDESLKISKYLGSKENNDGFRVFFDTLNSLELHLDKNGELDNIETNLYLKKIQPFISLVLIYSKKNSKKLIDRFDGFNLVNSKAAKKGENRIYSDSHKIFTKFFSYLNESADNALCLQFFDTYTEYIDIHYLAEKIRSAEVMGNSDKINFYLMLLMKIKSPLMKNTLINAVRNLDMYFRVELLEIYNSIFDKCKNSLKEYFVSIEGESKKGPIMYNNLEKYKRIFSLLGNNEQYEQLVYELMIHLKLIKDYEEELDPFDLEVFIEKMYGVAYSYSINHFGEAYIMIYNEKNQK